MARISDKSRQAAARAARAYLSGESVTRTTRGKPVPRNMSIAEVAQLHRATLPLTKKYISQLRSGKKLPSPAKKRGQPPALTVAEERALITFIRTVEKSAFAVTEACIRNYASFLRKHRLEGPNTVVSKAWVRRLKKRHPELQCKVPKVKAVLRAGAEFDLPKLEAWFKEYEAVVKEVPIQPANMWNFDETPLQLGWVNSSVKIFSTRRKKALGLWLSSQEIWSHLHQLILLVHPGKLFLLSLFFQQRYC